MLTSFLKVFNSITEKKPISALLLSIIILQYERIKGEQVLDRFVGEVGGGNFTFYRLQWPTTPVTILLESLEGDADLYVSDTTLTPDYEDNVLSSITCGEDRVHISREFRRPVGIGVFGHPLKELSKYRLSVLVPEGPEEVTYDTLVAAHNTYGDLEEASEKYSMKDHYKTDSKHVSKKEIAKPGSDEEESESLLWTILVAILKLVFEILT
ncbi:UPF0669 protein v1g209471-like [Lingula anatina]|uniref:UPF0669 protein v1g209471-like n=1 Tax=Lingula anatina TaxID=7574 RepID=A0A1S3JW82_LINAN|nr:UPF0669 protein v1g209471-like [Lingula anatina]|eukprot:XP_013414299.1 UPF0669 protein v1g209471-like [Lingula anatina]